MYNLVFNVDEERTIVAVIDNGDLVELYEEKKNEERLEGNIYVGKVKNIISGMQAAFIDIGETKNSLIHIKDLLPKASNITGNVYEDTSKMDISKIIKPKDEIIVQVKRDCNDQKGPRVTKDIKINGNFVILMPYSNFITVSQKIENAEEKERLKSIASKYLPKEYGAIIRTVANNRNEDKIKEDIEALLEKWKEILKKCEQLKGKAPTKIYDNGGIVGKIITDLSENNLEKIYTNNLEIVKGFKELQGKIEFIENSLEVFEIKNKMN